MKNLVTFLVNNDVSVNVPTTVEKGLNIYEQEISEAYHNLRLGKPKINSYVLTSVSGRLNFLKECETCGLFHSKAGFYVEYVRKEMNYWSVFYNIGCTILQHVDNKTFTPQRVEKLFNELETIEGYEKIFQKTAEAFIPQIKTVS